MNDIETVKFNDCILENIGWPLYLNFYINGKKYKNIFLRSMSDRLEYLENGESVDINHDSEVETPCFLLFDEYGGNYFHYFTDCFSKLNTFLNIKKINPNIKILIIEEYLDLSFIRDSLKLLFNNIDDIIIIPNNKKIKFKNLIVPKPLYYWPDENIPDIVFSTIEMISYKVNSDSLKNGIYISRQDTIKNNWWHNRDLKNELNLIDIIKKELNYDVVELMDLSLFDKIKIFKSYKNIIQQNSASTVNILFCNPNTNCHIISHPIMYKWANPLLKKMSIYKKLNFYEYNYGEICKDTPPTSDDCNNIPWEINNLSHLIQKVLENSKI